MSVSHIAVIWKIAAWSAATTVAAATAVVMDPTVKVAYIAGVFLVVAQIPAYILGYLNYRVGRTNAQGNEVIKGQNETIKVQMDGVQSRLENRNTQQREELTDAATHLHEKAAALSYAEGQREGSDRERDREIQK